MKILTQYIQTNVNTAVALGTFDGVHMAHRTLIEDMKAQAHGLATVACTFENTPASYFTNRAKCILTAEEKRLVLCKLGIDYAVLKPFDAEVAGMSAEAFMAYLFEKLNAKLVVAGFNYTFGAGAKGDCGMLSQYAKNFGAEVIIEDEIKFQGHRVSSTRIRNLVKEGDISHANTLLTRPYMISGEVVKGKRIGRTIGFPTVNIAPPAGKLLPAPGVYAVYVQLKDVMLKGMCNVGSRPTIEDAGATTVETHIFDF